MTWSDRNTVKTFPAAVPCSNGNDRRPGKNKSRDENNDPTIFPTHGDHCHQHLTCCSRIGPLEAFSSDILNYRPSTLIPKYRPSSSSDHVGRQAVTSSRSPPLPPLVSAKTAASLKANESRIKPGSRFRRRAALCALVCLTCVVFVSLGTVVCAFLAFGRRPGERRDVTGKSDMTSYTGKPYMTLDRPSVARDAWALPWDADFKYKRRPPIFVNSQYFPN